MAQYTRDEARGSGNTSNLTVSLFERDHEIVDFLVNYYGSSKSDVVRTAIRAHAALVMQMEGKR